MKTDLYLLHVINQMMIELDNPLVHHVILTRYFFYYDEMSYDAPIHFHRDSIERLEFYQEGLVCSLFPSPSSVHSLTVKIPYHYIRKISRYTDQEAEKEMILYINTNVLSQ